MSHRKKTIMFRLSIFVFALVSCTYMLPFIDADYSYYFASTTINEQLYLIDIPHRALDPIIWTLVTLFLLATFMESSLHKATSLISVPIIALVGWLLYFVSPYPAVGNFLKTCTYIPTAIYYLGQALGVIFLIVSVIFFLRRGLFHVKQKEIHPE